MNKLGLPMMILMLVRAALCAQQTTFDGSPDGIVPYRNESAAGDTSQIIFSNLAPLNGEPYDSDPYHSFVVAGKTAGLGVTETWEAVAFTPKMDVQARVLLAAITYISGTKKVNLGIYSNNDTTGSVGAPVPGGQGSTTQIPNSGSCCQLTRVTLQPPGVTLNANTQYWLVAGPDNVNAPTFSGSWQISNLGRSAYLAPPQAWSYPPGEWLAAEIWGTKLQTSANTDICDSSRSIAELSANGEKSIIFTTLDYTSTTLYNPNNGLLVQGINNGTGPEAWVALPFAVKANVHAKTLAAAIAYVSGTNKRVNLGIYADNQGEVGSLLPGGQGSTSEIPDAGTCCALTKVRLPGLGVALSAGNYWLVASPDDVDAPTFKGLWRVSNLALSAYQEPEDLTNWTNFNGNWLAAEIRGTRP